jgi:transcriptional regulator with AAA-type ATPase domain
MNKSEQKLVDLIGASEHIQYLKNEIDYVAKRITKLDMAVLITGPSGTGKELIAKAIAERSKLKIVPVNCGAIASELFESEMFGHKKGSFTNALSDKKGLVEEAENGILFLDEIGDLDLNHQAKFLRFLQDKKLLRVGETIQKSLKNITIIAATNKDLGKEIKEGRFREDLFYRLQHHNIQTIPIKGRHVDIICLVNHFVHKNGVKINLKVKFLLYSYDFPGNVRELETLIYSSDDFEYVRAALRKNVTSIIGIDAEVISRFKSLKEFDRKIKPNDMIDMTNEWRRNRRDKEGLSELSWREILHRNPDANEFLRATFFAEENDCSEVVRAYEIMTLRLCPGLPKDGISQILHIGNEKVYDKYFKETFGLDFSKEGGINSYSEPIKIYPHFTSYWGHKKNLSLRIFPNDPFCPNFTIILPYILKTLLDEHKVLLKPF